MMIKSGAGQDFKYGAILLTVCLISALSLSLAYKMTSDAVRNTDDENIARVQREVLPLARTFRASPSGAAAGFLADGRAAGRAIIASARGYGGDVTFMVGVDVKGAVAGVKALSHKETPGLGTKALTPEYLAQYIGKKADKIKLKKDDPSGGTIDAVTGATITSRAVASAVADALSKIAAADGQ